MRNAYRPGDATFCASPHAMAHPAFVALLGAGASTGLGDSQNYTDMETEPREPVPVAGNHSFALIAAGVNHACAIELEGSLWCWGTSPGNGYGKDTLKPMEITASQGPEEEDPPPPPLEPYVALSAGERQTCAIDSAQAAWCFGEQQQTDGPVTAALASVVSVDLPLLLTPFVFCCRCGASRRAWGWLIQRLAGSPTSCWGAQVSQP